MRNNSTIRLALNGLMIALVFLATYFTRIPTPLPGGYFNLGDAVIMLAAAFLGPAGGLIAGGIGSSFADLAAGAFIFAPITLVVKGIEGLVIGLLAVKFIWHRSSGMTATQDTLAQKTVNQQASYNPETGSAEQDASISLSLIPALVAGAIIMVAGYFTAEAFVLSLFDNAFGIVAAAGELVPNLIQGGLSAVLGYFLILLLSKVGVNKYIR